MALLVAGSVLCFRQQPWQELEHSWLYVALQPDTGAQMSLMLIEGSRVLQMSAVLMQVFQKQGCLTGILTQAEGYACVRCAPPI